MDESEADDRHELAVEIEELEALRLQAGDQPRADRLPLDMVVVKEEVFQARLGKLAEKHLSDLSRPLKAGKELEPILVMPSADKFVLIDGHHRREAYHRAKRSEIPVRYFEGTAQDALLESGRLNSQAKLPLDNTQRQNCAWRLVLSGLYSKKQIEQSASISGGQVANMRRAMKALGANVTQYPQWWQASEAYKAMLKEEELPEFSQSDLEERAQRLADGIVKAISTRPANNPEIMARALEIYLGRNAWEVCKELQHLCHQSGLVPDDDEDDDY